MEGPNQPESIKYLEIAAEITAMYDADQNMRIKAEEDDSIWDEAMDPRNTARMKEIVEEIGWPTISKVGEKASGDAWLLVQHADKDVEFQRHCLELMKAEQAGEVALHDIAYLEDRVRVNSGRPQLYGTQFRWTEDNKPIQDIEDPQRVEERRKEMGLNTLAENLEDMYEAYKIPRLEKFTNWIRPNLQNERSEIERTLREFIGSVPTPQEIDKLITDIEATQVTELTDEEWEKLENTDSFHNVRPDHLEDAEKITDEYNTDLSRGNQRSVQALVDAFNSGLGMEVPVILKNKQGGMHLISGNTRLMVARALKIRPNVIITEYKKHD